MQPTKTDGSHRDGAKSHYCGVTPLREDAEVQDHDTHECERKDRTGHDLDVKCAAEDTLSRRRHGKRRERDFHCEVLSLIHDVHKVASGSKARAITIQS